MATDTSSLAVYDPESLAEPRKIEARLLMELGVLAAGGLLWALFLTGDGIQRGIGTIDKAHAAAQPTTCGPEDVPMKVEGVTAIMGLHPSLTAAQPQAEFVQPNGAAGRTTEAAEPTARRSAPAVRRSNNVPTYVRRAGPEPDAAQLALEALRRSL